MASSDRLSSSSIQNWPKFSRGGARSHAALPARRLRGAVAFRLERLAGERRNAGPQRRNLERVAGDRPAGRLGRRAYALLEAPPLTHSSAPAALLDGHRCPRRRG